MTTVIHERHLSRGRRWKRRKDRRVFREVVEAHEREVVTLHPLRTGFARDVPRAKLVQDFMEVARCPTCGWHVGVRVPHGHAWEPISSSGRRSNQESKP